MKLPQTVKIVEVGPRDGFQSINKWIPTDLKIEIISGLISANLNRLEVTSFVHPKAIPQMQDAAEVVHRVIDGYKGMELIALVPNYTGAKAAWEAGIKEVTYVISASEKHNIENVRRTKAESFADLRNIKELLPELTIKLDIATAFGCPFLGQVPVEQVLQMMEDSLKLGIDEVCLCDTIGIANPLQTESLLVKVITGYPGAKLSLHFHDTRGMGLANTLVALECGITTFESAIGGLGGCPFAPGAAGNIATEDMVNMLEQMGIDTGIDLPVLLQTAKTVKAKIVQELSGHLVSMC